MQFAQRFLCLVKFQKNWEDTNYQDAKSLLSIIYEYMDTFPVLLVLDNLETINTEDIHDFFANIPRKSKVLITSRIGLGEFEDRYRLRGFEKKERIYYMRRLADYYQVESLKKLKDNKLDQICTKLYSNPLSMKWLMMNLAKGYPIQSILQNKDDLINYCMSNVYIKLSDEAKL